MRGQHDCANEHVSERPQVPETVNSNPNLNMASSNADLEERCPHADTVLRELGLKYECSDYGNMRRFVDQHLDKLRYVPERKAWLIWDGTRYRAASDAEVFKLATETAKSIYDEAKECPTEMGSKRLGDWASKSQSEPKLRAMISMASKSPALEAHQSAFDRDPFLLNCVNGLVDLRTGALIERGSEALVTKLAPVAYDPKAKCPTFHRFLRDVFCGDEELIGWVQRAIGYSLTGVTTEQVLFLAYGTGANGKTTFFETLLDVLGDYGRAAEFDTFLASDRSSARVMEGLAKLQGIRLAVASEADSARRFSEALVKRATGGDTVTGTFLYGHSFEFRPQFKLWLLANHLPIAKDGTHGFWRRVRVVPFNRRFEASEMDQRMRERLLAEKEGILAWCIQGAIGWHRSVEEVGSGIGRCRAVEEATNEYRYDNDTFSRFLDDTLVEDPSGEIAAGDLYEAYEAWCRSAGVEEPCSQTIFGCRMKERGIPKRRTSRGYVYVGIGLKTRRPISACDF